MSALVQAIPESVADEYAKGSSYVKIGHRLGIQPALIRQWLMDKGIEIRPTGQIKSPANPPTRLPDGSWNPAYLKIRSKRPSSKRAAKKFYEKKVSEEGRTTRCVNCKTTFFVSDALERGYPSAGYGVICDECTDVNL